MESEFFTIDKCHKGANSEQALSQRQMKILLFITGCGKILSRPGSTVEFSAGDCLLIPAGDRAMMQFAGDTQYLMVRI